MKSICSLAITLLVMGHFMFASAVGAQNNYFDPGDVDDQFSHVPSVPDPKNQYGSAYDPRLDAQLQQQRQAEMMKYYQHALDRAHNIMDKGLNSDRRSPERHSTRY